MKRNLEQAYERFAAVEKAPIREELVPAAGEVGQEGRGEVGPMMVPHRTTALQRSDVLAYMQALKRNHGCGTEDCRTEKGRCRRYGFTIDQSPFCGEELFEVMMQHLDGLLDIAWEWSKEGRQARLKQDQGHDDGE